MNGFRSFLLSHTEPRARRRLRAGLVVTLGVVSLAVAIVGLAVPADMETLSATFRAGRSSPGGVALALGAFAVAFLLRAHAWRRVLPRLGFGHAWAAIHVSLAGNHVLPLRLGEALRVTSVVRRTDTTLHDAAASTLTLRAADTVAVALLAGVSAPHLLSRVLGPWGWAAIGVVAMAGLLGWRRLAHLARHGSGSVRLPGPSALAATFVAWGFETVLVSQAAGWAGLHLNPLDAATVTAVSVAAQIAAIAPGGLGTYETAATAAYVALGYSTEAGLAAAVAAHATKTAYSVITGWPAMFLPRPGLLGRFRLNTALVNTPRHQAPEDRTAPLSEAPELGDGPIVLILPAYNEEATVGSVVRRTPAFVANRPVRCVVVDDGSTDRTSERAADAGAHVLRSGANSGLGAAVRIGLADALDQGASAVAFCDADGEYAPEELERLVAPILAGEADYVVGSRFLGRPDRMLAHRRAGNLVLTALLRLIARRRITDGQSGYRALSPAATRAAEIIHDYNYAQVLTLDLLAKGYRYAEVPISYRFRTEGHSFIRLPTYLRRVAPAVWRELNTS